MGLGDIEDEAFLLKVIEDAALPNQIDLMSIKLNQHKKIFTIYFEYCPPFFHI